MRVSLINLSKLIDAKPLRSLLPVAQVLFLVHASADSQFEPSVWHFFVAHFQNITNLLRITYCQNSNNSNY